MAAFAVAATTTTAACCLACHAATIQQQKNRVVGGMCCYKELNNIRTTVSLRDKGNGKTTPQLNKEAHRIYIGSTAARLDGTDTTMEDKEKNNSSIS